MRAHRGLLLGADEFEEPPARLRTAKFGRRPTVKKAIITLAEGDSINLI